MVAFECLIAFEIASSAGLFYLALYLVSKFNACPSYILPVPLKSVSSQYRDHAAQPTGTASTTRAGKPVDPSQDCHEAAAPPTWLLLFSYIPIGAVVYISASRYFDYRHVSISHSQQDVFSFIAPPEVECTDQANLLWN